MKIIMNSGESIDLFEYTHIGTYTSIGKFTPFEIKALNVQAYFTDLFQDDVKVIELHSNEQSIEDVIINVSSISHISY